MRLQCMVVWGTAILAAFMLNRRASCQKTVIDNKQDWAGTSPEQNQNRDSGEGETSSTDPGDASDASSELLGMNKNLSDERLNANLTKPNKLIDISIDTATDGKVYPVSPGVLVMFQDSERVFAANYTLRCPHPHAHYLLRVTLQQISHQMTADLSSPVSVNISCQHGNRVSVEGDQNGTEDKYDIEVDNRDKGTDYIEESDGIKGRDGDLLISGTVNIPITTQLLGKSVLLFFMQALDGQMCNRTSFSGSPKDGNLDAFEAGSRTFPMPQTSDPESASNNDSTSTGTASTTSPLPSAQLVHKAVLLVFRPRRVIDVVFRVAIYVFIVMATVAMGCKTDLQVVKGVLKKPSAPAIGFFCQYVCMPLIAYGVARSIKLENDLVSFGIFACGVCPGGGVSNMYTYLLGGDLSLSVTLTIISTIAALGMIPFWLFTLGRTLRTGTGTLNIPFLKIMETLATIVLPLFLGLFLQYRFPRVAKTILKVIKPVFVLGILFMLSVGIYANFYIFRLFKPITILAGCMLPYFGYLVGGVISFIFRQSWARVKTIALETGIQNVGVAFLLLLFSLPPPYGELSAVGPAASAVMTGLPPLLLSIVYAIYNKVKGKPEEKEEREKEGSAMLQTPPNGNIGLSEDKTGQDEKMEVEKFTILE